MAPSFWFLFAWNVVSFQLIISLVNYSQSVYFNSLELGLVFRRIMEG